MTDGEVANKLLGAWRYVGTRINGSNWDRGANGTVTHHRHDSLQPGDKGDLVRRYDLNGDRLVLRAPNSTLEVTWERIT